MTKCAVQRELLQAVINKVLYTLLLEQQRILVTLQFPRFSKTFLPRIENMSLFTTAPNASSLFEDLTTREIVSQRKFVCALLSLRLVGGRKIRRFAPLAPIRTDATSNNSNDGEHSSSNSSSKEVAEAVPDVLAFLNSIEVPVEDAANATTVNTPGSGRKKRRRAESSTSPDDKNLEMVYLARRESYGQEDNMRVVNSAVDDEDGSSALVPQLVSSSYDQVMPAGFQEDQDSNSGSEMEGYDDEGEEEQARFSDVDENMQT